MFSGAESATAEVLDVETFVALLMPLACTGPNTLCVLRPGVLPMPLPLLLLLLPACCLLKEVMGPAAAAAAAFAGVGVMVARDVCWKAGALVRTTAAFWVAGGGDGDGVGAGCVGSGSGLCVCVCAADFVLAGSRAHFASVVQAV